MVLDFDEHLAKSVLRCANKDGIVKMLTSRLHHIGDALYAGVARSKDGFCTNATWGTGSGRGNALAFGGA